MEIGLKIKETRLKSGLTQEALALKAGFERSYVNQLERGKYKNITIQTARKLAEALGVSADELLGTESGDKSGLPDKSVADMLKTFTSDFADKLQKLEIVEIPIRGIIPGRR